ncbi:hypothetical protein ACP70R_018437 [Stipagrostis hirtigluma subsp. patula]
MVCMPGQFKMASVLKLVVMENHTAPDEVISEMNTAQILQKQLFDAHEPNLLNEDGKSLLLNRQGYNYSLYGSYFALPGGIVFYSFLNAICIFLDQNLWLIHWTWSAVVLARSQSRLASMQSMQRCNSSKVNTDDSMSVDDRASPTKPSKKGRKINLTSNGNQKVHIKVKVKPLPENKNSANGFELDNGHVSKVQHTDTTADQRLTSVDNAAVISVPENGLRDAPAPLATKMYHSQGNYRLRLELGQLYRQSCAEHFGSHPTSNTSHENGMIVSKFSPCDISALHGAQKSLVPQTKVLASTSESGIPQQLSSGPNCSRETKSERTDTQASAVKNETLRSRCNKTAVPHMKSKGNKKTQKQTNGTFHGIKSSVE